MTDAPFVRTLATIACTVVLSATCVLGAIAPAQSEGRAQVSVSRAQA